MINTKTKNTTKNKTRFSNKTKIILLSIICVVFILLYQFYDINYKFFDYAMYIRTPKTITMILVAICIGTASMMFQSIIRNRIVTPCLLGMNSLYIFIHTAVVFFLGTSSILATNKYISFTLDLVLMVLLGTFIYKTLFKKTNYNILYVLLAGSVLATLFTSISNTMTRVIDPNEYDVLLSELVAGFDHVNSELLLYASTLTILTLVLFYKRMKLLDVISLGKNQAINLGADYDKSISLMLIAVVILITIATALVGPISFLGLIIANLAREYFITYKHSYLIIGSILMGILVLFGGQFIIEHIVGFGTQISVFINLFGGLYFLYLIYKNKGVQ